MLTKNCTKSDSIQQLAKKFYNTTICKKIIWHNNQHKNKNVEKCFLWANFTQVFSWESHETSTIPPSRIFPKGHSMICSFFLLQGWVNLLTNSKLGGFKGCFAFHNVGFMVKGSTVVGLK